MFLSGDSFLQQATTGVLPTPVTDYIIVCINRPGYHGSSPVEIGTFSYKDFAHDVQELADHLDIDKFSVVGHSSGGPNALACASFLKDRVMSIGIMAGDPEYYAEDDNDNEDDDERKEQEEKQQQHQQQHDNNEGEEEDDHCQQQGSSSSTTMTDWFLGWCLPNCMRFVPFIQVTNGLKNDYYLERQKYPFRTEEITQPAVVVLGDQDAILPNEVAVKVHNRLPNSQLKMLEGVGHNQLLEDDILDMIFRTVIDLAARKKQPQGGGGVDQDDVDELLQKHKDNMDRTRTEQPALFLQKS
ncbi:MAG: hypothetical protein SGILL_006513 [Bacillariaceae sp.]